MYHEEDRKDETYTPVRVTHVGYMDENGLEGVLTFMAEDGRVFSMRAFSGEVASHIARFISGDRSSIPTIYRVVESLADTFGAHLLKVEIYPSKDVLRADLYFVNRDKKIFTLKGFRASDAVALATFYDVAIYVQDTLLLKEV
jgi:bifunctional DNase/RNase